RKSIHITTKKYKSCTKKFNLEALSMVRDSNRPLTDVAIELGVPDWASTA
ncbi:MAG: hypothetical protein ACI9WC_003911, partial [Arenicella sp.]